MEEVSFPRSNTKRYFSDGGVRLDAKVFKKDDDLFKQAANLDGPKKKGKRKGSSLGTTKPSKKMKVSVLGSIIKPLDHEMLTPGMVILGCIQSVKKYAMVVNLPNSLFGSVSIVDISDSYTALLKKYAENESDENSNSETLSGLSEMFSVGSYVVCKVKEIISQGKERPRIILTMNPKELHEEITPSVLYNGMLLTAAVMSVEDHGYVMDVGIAKLSAFLKFDKAHSHGSHLKVGQLALCIVDLPGSQSSLEKVRVLELNSQHKAVEQAMAAVEGVNMRALLPGTLVSAKVVKVEENGLIVNFSNHKGIVLHSHLQDPFQSLTYFESKVVKGRILCVQPLTKLTYISLQKQLVKLFPAVHFGGLKIGDHISEAKVLDVVKNNVYFMLHKGVKGVAPPSKLARKRKDVKDNFPLGSAHKCVVKRFKWMDNIVMVSLLQKDFEVNLDDLKPGFIVQCVVKDIQEKGIGLTVTDGVRGFIPLWYIDDKPVTKLGKVFKVGQQLLCRILKVKKENKLLILTSKPSMLSSKLPILSSYQDAQPNMIVEGCIYIVAENYILVAFYNDVKGYLSSKELQEGLTTGAFTRGQPIKCMVTECVPSKTRLRLSMKMPGCSPSYSTAGKFPVGKVVSCEVTNIEDDGVLVKIIPSGIKAMLPNLHLSDYLSNCHSLRSTLNPGDVIEKVACFSSEYPPIVTMKKSVIDWIEGNEVVSHIDGYKVGMIAPLSVRNVCPFGVFVNLLHNIKALVPIKELSTTYVSDISDCGFSIHQTLVGVVVSVDAMQKKLSFSIKPTHGFNITEKDNLTYLENFLKEQSTIRSRFASCGHVELQNLAFHNVGSVVNFTVKIVNEYGAVGYVENGIKALVTIDHMKSVEIVVDDTIPALVLALDFNDCCLELLVDHSIINAVVNSPKLDLTEVKNGQKILPSVVLLAKMEYILVMVHDEAKKGFGYLPFKKHFNDIPKMKDVPIFGDNLNIIALSVMDDAILGLPATNLRKDLQMEKTRVAHFVSKPSQRKVRKRNLKVRKLQQSVEQLKEKAQKLKQMSTINKQELSNGNQMANMKTKKSSKDASKKISKTKNQIVNAKTRKSVKVVSKKSSKMKNGFVKIKIKKSSKGIAKKSTNSSKLKTKLGKGKLSKKIVKLNNK